MLTHIDIGEQTRAMVRAYLPADERDAAASIEILRALDDLAEPFSRNAQMTHLTASAIVVGHRGTVLHRHKITGTWLQPGGHIDTGETPGDAAIREVLEETGLRATHRDASRFFDLDAHDTPRGHRHLDLRFLLDASGDDPVPGAGESQDVRWFSWDDALIDCDASLRDVLPRAKAWI